LTAQPEVSHPALADEPPAQDDRRPGRIPLHLRVGVTGHRDIDVNDETLTSQVRGALDRIGRYRTGTANTPVSLTVVSALAEGADRIVAREAMKRGASLEVVLPLPAGDYLTDFESDTSKAEFCGLLGKASAITEVPVAGQRDEAYERAGHAVVDRSDVLIALWDGHVAQGKGGTAHIVSYGRRQHVPVVQVQVKRLDPKSPRPRNADEPPPPEFFGLLSNDAFELLDHYNSRSLRTGAKDTESPLLPDGLKAPVPAYVQSLADYAQPYYYRAERVARHSQRLFRLGSLLLYSLAALAVILVATQVIFLPHDPQTVWAEAVALATVFVALIIGRRTRLHDRWLAARYLAERLRSGLFLAAVGVDFRPAGGEPRPAGDDRQAADAAEPDPNQEWIERAFHEIYWRARRFAPPESEPGLGVLRALLIEAWVEDQVKYHQRVGERMSGRQREFNLLAVVLFGVSALAALLHSLNLVPSGPDVLGYLSVVIPAVGAAISGYSAQREYARLAQRSRQMVDRLKEARQQFEHPGQLSSLQNTVRRTELLMRSETSDWYAVFRLRDFEFPS
jgi:SMODS and SLOG-associating 2TM effector domain 1